MDFGIVLFTSDRGISPADAAVAAEKNGFRTFYVPEHSHIPTKREVAHPVTGDASLPDDRYMRTLDPWVSLATACAVTTEIRLSTAVCLPVAHDCITLAKSIASLDHLSGGRVEVCAGFGWNLDELADHNVPAGSRRNMLREYIEAMRELWIKEEASYSGEFVNYGPSWAWPKTVQEHVPVLIGATGNEKNFKWIAKHADGWMSTPKDADVQRSVNSLYAEWDSAGRTGRPRVVVLDMQKPEPSRLSLLADLGVSEVVYGIPDRPTEEAQAHLARLADKVDTFGRIAAGAAAQ
ncbi:LLM class F420-dependent oxidoreductase [Mycolicibacterium stellerae]|uniref:LLM class F420-dependent oxidoreductase n=1 Tax=Mycolicibacterium stellerae TaxID=2358193 RepID=UPI000F0AF775|nr:LLM class F420-dependent oxidoreductase [Mycolicibacterium stellerae]